MSDTYVPERFRILKRTRCEIQRTLRGARARRLPGLRREWRRDRQRHRKLRVGSREIGHWRQRLWTRDRSLRRKKIFAQAASKQTESTLFPARFANPAPAKMIGALRLFPWRG